jgi:hypothetical protein
MPFLLTNFKLDDSTRRIRRFCRKYLVIKYCREDHANLPDWLTFAEVVSLLGEDTTNQLLPYFLHTNFEGQPTIETCRLVELLQPQGRSHE